MPEPGICSSNLERQKIVFFFHDVKTSFFSMALEHRTFNVMEKTILNVMEKIHIRFFNVMERIMPFLNVIEQFYFLTRISVPEPGICF